MAIYPCLFNNGSPVLGNKDDPFNIRDDYTKYNLSSIYSSYYVENDVFKKQIVCQLAAASGYEGFCISLDGLGLVDGNNYTLNFVLEVPNTVSFSGSYPWGVKYSSTRYPASGSANSNTFNTSPTVDFLQQTGEQNVSLNFTASTSNYLVVCLSRVAAGATGWIRLKDINIS